MHRLVLGIIGLVLMALPVQAKRLDVGRLKVPAVLTPGTIVVDTVGNKLFYKLPNGTVLAYTVTTGDQLNAWSGEVIVAKKAVWPDWSPTTEMLKQRPWLPKAMAGGPGNPLGARALYLYDGTRDTRNRIHGTSEPWSIGLNISSGCIRMRDEDVEELYELVPIGTKVIVLK
jgi:lipoprotein-anchoring transpeptidase ErfK/SrfK